MKKDTTYYKTKFPASTISEVYQALLSKCKSDKTKFSFSGKITINNVGWEYDTIEEFLAEYPKTLIYQLSLRIPDEKIEFFMYAQDAYVYVCITSKDRQYIESISSIFERDVDKSKITIKDETPIKVFIGHGGNAQWRDLKDHLHDYHNYQVNHYEIGPRAGLSVKDVLEKMLNESSIAFLVLTGEDEKNYGELHARQNVVHELGLFQGRLGFTRAIVLLEEGVTEFSNIYGVNQIRFSKGNIRETFGDVLAIINREFPK